MSFFEMEDRYDLFVKNKVIRSPSTLVINVNGGSRALREKLALQRIIVGSGYGGYKDEHVRIANFPAHTVAQVEKLLDSLGKS